MPRCLLVAVANAGKLVAMNLSRILSLMDCVYFLWNERLQEPYNGKEKRRAWRCEVYDAAIGKSGASSCTTSCCWRNDFIACKTCDGTRVLMGYLNVWYAIVNLDQGPPNFSARGPHCFKNNYIEDHLTLPLNDEWTFKSRLYNKILTILIQFRVT